MQYATTNEEVGHAQRKMFIATLQKEHRCRSRQIFGV